jgi:hypothetical protein
MYNAPENGDFFAQTPMSVWNEFKTFQGLSVPLSSATDVTGDATICHICVHRGTPVHVHKQINKEKNTGVQYSLLLLRTTDSLVYLFQGHESPAVTFKNSTFANKAY